MKKCIPIIGVVLAIGSTQAMALNDPFIKQWIYSDGMNTYNLKIEKSSAPGQDYYIYYAFPGGHSSTDMCKATSNTSFNCLTGETITRDDANYAIKLTSSNGNYTFYDPNHLPPAFPIFGNWSWHSQGATYTITIMKGSSDAEYNVLTSFSDDRGNYCRYSNQDAYQVAKNPDGTELITNTSGYTTYRFMYDPHKAQIVNPKPTEYFRIGRCIEGIVADGPVIFTKD